MGHPLEIYIASYPPDATSPFGALDGPVGPAILYAQTSDASRVRPDAAP
jgi:hypothetical protein